MARRYGEELRRVVSSGRYDNYEDFAVILSPALEDLEVPVARAPADSFLRVLVKICRSSQQKTISTQNDKKNPPRVPNGRIYRTSPRTAFTPARSYMHSVRKKVT